MIEPGAAATTPKPLSAFASSSHEGEGQDAGAMAAVFLGDEGPEESCLRDGPRRLVVVLLRLVVLRGERSDVLVSDPAGDGLELLGLVGEGAAVCSMGCGSGTRQGRERLSALQRPLRASRG